MCHTGITLLRAGISLSRPPMVCKAPLDLYRVYNSVQHHGGFLNVSWHYNIIEIVDDTYMHYPLIQSPEY